MQSEMKKVIEACLAVLEMNCSCPAASLCAGMEVRRAPKRVRTCGSAAPVHYSKRRWAASSMAPEVQRLQVRLANGRLSLVQRWLTHRHWWPNRKLATRSAMRCGTAAVWR
jgi:hypothetical protein